MADAQRSQAEPRDSLTARRRAYWRANLRLVAACLAVWFVVSYGFGILAVDALNRIQIGGFKLGFWFAQQGSIYVFLALVCFYAWRMNTLDRKFGRSRDDEGGRDESGKSDS